MIKFLSYVGRTLQLLGLLLLPSAIWVTEVEKSEAKALTIFFMAPMIFFAGWILVRRKA